MAQKVIISLEDDIDGSPAAETVNFGLDGRTYEIDLNDKNASKLRTSLEKFVEAARPIRGSGTAKRTGTKTTLGPSAREVRDWARSNGYDLPDRGRIPGDIRQAFDAAH